MAIPLLPAAEAPPPEASFMARLRANLRRIGGPAALLLMQAWYAATSQDMPKLQRAALFGALAWFVLPMDALPDFTIIGFSDDIAIAAAALAFAQPFITQAMRDRAQALFASLFGGTA
jgi:uncharacterized membrane protein YkvA (DUF1232 family)